jgi:hypothetical protein
MCFKHRRQTMQIDIQTFDNTTIQNITRENLLDYSRNYLVLLTPDQWKTVLNVETDVNGAYNWLDNLLDSRPFLAVNDDRHIAIYTGKGDVFEFVDNNWSRVTNIFVAVTDGRIRKPFITFFTNRPLAADQMETMNRFWVHTTARLAEYLGTSTMTYVLSDIANTEVPYFYYTENIHRLKGPANTLLRFDLIPNRQNGVEWTDEERYTYIGKFDPDNGTFAWPSNPKHIN